MAPGQDHPGVGQNPTGNSPARHLQPYQHQPSADGWGPLFRVEAGEPIIVTERFGARRGNHGRTPFDLLDHAAPNTVVLKHGQGDIYCNWATGRAPSLSGL
jgi:hypothetical protein